MQLREIHIDGFGIFADARVRGLAPGLNVLYGQNEFGKTTLLEFIRRVLFGFPSRATSANPFPPLRGGKYGGRLVCRMREPSAPELTISRTSGKGGGPLTVHAANGVEMSESEFSASLGHVSDELYRNVFAISLQELQAAKQLQGEELRSRIYGAGLGLGEVSITDLKKFFAEAAERLYKPRGSTQQMNVLASALVDVERRIRETARLLGQYDAKKEEFDRYAEDEARLRKIQGGLQAEQRSLERQSSLYGTFVGLRAAEDELKPLARLPDISDASLDELRKRQQSILSLEGKLQETRDQRAGRQSELDHLAFDRALLEPFLELELRTEAPVCAVVDIAGDDDEIGLILNGYVNDVLKRLEGSAVQHPAALFVDLRKSTKRGVEVQVCAVNELDRAHDLRRPGEPGALYAEPLCN
jgi:uncharacterized protein YhaN